METPSLKTLASGCTAMLLTLALICLLPGCSSGQGASSSSSTGASSADASIVEAAETVQTSTDTAAMDFSYSKRDADASYDSASATTVKLADNASTSSGDGASISGNIVTITREGTYVVSGSLSDGQLVVAAADDAKVQIVLNGVSISCSSGPCLYVTSADKVFVTLDQNAVNTLSDGAWTVGEEDEINATVYSTADISFNGSGALTMNSTAYHAIKSTDDLVICGGTYTITSAQDALRGKDCVKINAGTFAIEAGADGIKSANTDDADRGFVSIDGGTFDIKAGDDGIQAAHYIRLMDGQITIEAADDAVHSDLDALVAGGTHTITSGDDAVHGEYNLDITGGTITVDDCYEGLEGQTITVSGGTTRIHSEDDGLNAAAVSSGSSTDAAAGEGGGAGAGGGDMMGGGGNRMQQVPAENQDPNARNNARAMGQAPATGMEEGGFSSAASLTISGGTLVVVTSTGDAIDSNGALNMTGGTVFVSGPTNNNNGSLDYDTTGTITGGTFIAAGSSGMAQTFDSSSTQASVVASASGNAGDLISIVDESGTVICSYRTELAYSIIIASAPGIANDTPYNVVIGGTNSAADVNGFATSGTVEGGSSLGSVTATTAVQGSMGMGGMKGGGGMDGKQKTMPQGAPQEGMGGMQAVA